MGNEKAEIYKSYVWILVLVLNSTLGSFLFGYSLGVFNPVQDLIASFHNWGENKDYYLGLITSFLPLGAMFGAIISSPLSNYGGRMKAMVFADGLACIGIILGMIDETTTLLLFRIVTGVAVGINSVIVPLYISEMTPKSISGKMGSFTQLVINLGTLVAFLLALVLPYNSSYTSSSFFVQNWWRFMFAFPFLTCSLRSTLLILVFPYDTPRSLVCRKSEEDALMVISVIYKREFVEGILEETVKEVNEQSGSTYFQLLSRRQRPRLVVALLINIIQQMSGINSIVFYSDNIFSTSELGHSVYSKSFTIAVSVVLIISAYLSGAIVDRAGRRTVMIWGEMACIFTMGLLSTLLYSGLEASLPYLILAFLFSYGISLGPVVWLYTPEVINSKGCSLAGLANWLTCFLISLCFLPIKTAIGLEGQILLFAIFGVSGLAYIIVFVKETKGKSAESIEEEFLIELESDEMISQ